MSSVNTAHPARQGLDELAVLDPVRVEEIQWQRFVKQRPGIRE